MFRCSRIEGLIKEQVGIKCQVWLVRAGGYIAIIDSSPVGYVETSSIDDQEISRVFARDLHYQTTGKDLYEDILNVS